MSNSNHINPSKIDIHSLSTREQFGLLKTKDKLRMIFVGVAMSSPVWLALPGAVLPAEFLEAATAEKVTFGVNLAMGALCGAGLLVATRDR